MTDHAESEISFFGVLITVLILLSQGVLCRVWHMYKEQEAWRRKELCEFFKQEKQLSSAHLTMCSSIL